MTQLKYKKTSFNNFDELLDKKYYSAKLVNTDSHSRKVSYWLYGTVFIIAIILFLPWTQNFKASGKLTALNPADRPQTVHATIAGRIEKWFLQEGQFVKKGDTILFLSEIKDKFFDPNFLIRIEQQINAKEGALSSTKNKASALNKQINALQSGLKFSLNKARNKVEQNKLKVQSDSIDFIASKTNFDIAKVQYERQEKLYNDGLKSLTDLEARRLKYQEAQAKLLSSENKFFAAKNEMMNSVIELNSLEAEYLDKISKAESELNSTLSYFYESEGQLSKMNNEFANMQIRNSFYYITAPQDGYLVKALKSGIGETIKEGEDVASIMPYDPMLSAEIYVDPMDVILLQKGSKIRLQFEGWPIFAFSGWPNISFGTFGGIVKVIDNTDTKGKFRVLVAPDVDDEPWPHQLRIGTGVNGWAMLNNVPVWYEVWRQLNGFPPEYVHTEEKAHHPYTHKHDKEESEKE